MKNNEIIQTMQEEGKIIDAESEDKQYNEEEQIDTKPDVDFSNNANNSLEYASIISRESEVKKQFKQIPKELRYSFLEKQQGEEVLSKILKYEELKYLIKISKLQYQEDYGYSNIRKSLYSIVNKKDLEIYFRKMHLYPIFIFLEEINKIDEVIKHISSLRPQGFYENEEEQNKFLNSVYSDYRENWNDKTPDYVDDMGYIAYNVGISEESKGIHGRERNATITTIQSTSHVDLKKEEEERSRMNPLNWFRRAR